LAARDRSPKGWLKSFASKVCELAIGGYGLAAYGANPAFAGIDSCFNVQVTSVLGRRGSLLVVSGKMYVESSSREGHSSKGAGSGAPQSSNWNSVMPSRRCGPPKPKMHFVVESHVSKTAKRGAPERQGSNWNSVMLSRRCGPPVVQSPRCTLSWNPTFPKPRNVGHPGVRVQTGIRLCSAADVAHPSPRCTLSWNPTFRKPRNVGHPAPG
jgi:hypothetical protein